MSYDILTEEFGGQVQCAKVSAKSGEGIDELLEKVLLQVTQLRIERKIVDSSQSRQQSRILLIIMSTFIFHAGRSNESTGPHRH